MSKYIFKISTLLSIITSVLSCDTDFEIDKLDAEPMFYIESIFFDEQEIIEISVVPTYVITEEPRVSELPEGFSLTVLENGEPRQLHKADDTFQNPKFKWYLAGGVKPGTELEISAKAEGYPKAYSKVVVPEKFADFTCSVEKYTDGMAILHIDYCDNPDTEDYYAVSVERNVRQVRFDGTVDADVSYPIIHTPLQDDFGEYPYCAWNIEGVSWPEYRNIVFWNDSRDTVAGKQRMTIFISEKQSSEDSFDYTGPTLGGGGEVIGKTHVGDYVTVYKLTPGTYHYINGKWNEFYNDLSNMGFVPPTWTFTNIDGGTGILGPMSSSEPYHIEWTYFN